MALRHREEFQRPTTSESLFRPCYGVTIHSHVTTTFTSWKLNSMADAHMRSLSVRVLGLAYSISIFRLFFDVCWPTTNTHCFRLVDNFPESLYTICLGVAVHIPCFRWGNRMGIPVQRSSAVKASPTLGRQRCIEAFQQSQ